MGQKLIRELQRDLESAALGAIVVSMSCLSSYSFEISSLNFLSCSSEIVSVIEFIWWKVRRDFLDDVDGTTDSLGS